MEDIFDVIIIGGGPAGSTAATLLSRKGHKVILLEKEEFPRAHVGESMLSMSYELFKELGVLDEMEKTFVRKPGVEFTDTTGSKRTEWVFQHVIKDASHLSFHVSRDKFDHLLLKNSIKNGALVLEKQKVVKAELGQQSAVTVTSINEEGTKSIFKGRFLLDASGQGTFLANQFKSKMPFEGIGKRVAINDRWSHPSLDTSLSKGNLKIIRLDNELGGWIWMIPIEEQSISIGVVLSQEYFNREKRSKKINSGDLWLEEIYEQVISATPEAAQIINGAVRNKSLQVHADFSYKSTNNFGKNYACIGDSSSFIDPIFASGVYLAMKSAFMISEGVAKILSNQGPSELVSVFKKIDHAYDVVRELIINFYDPHAIKLSDMGKMESSPYEQQSRAFKIFHLIITGKFFDIPESYKETVKLLRDEKRFRQFEHYVVNK